MLFYFPSLGQQTWCTTQSSANAVAYHAPAINADGPFYLRVYVHVIRRTNRTGGQILEQVKEGLRLMDEWFNLHNIFFVWDCNIDFIDNGNLFVSSSLSPAFDINNHSDGIDIYLGPEKPWPNDTGGGFASASILSAGNYLVMGNLVVESGATFTIPLGATLNFQEDSKLIAKQNVRLNLTQVQPSF